MRNLPVSSLGDACEFVLDGTHGSPERVEAGIPVLSATNVNHGELETTTGRYTTKEEYEAFKKRIDLKKGDVLFTIVGSIGRCAVVQDPIPLVFQRSVGILRPKENITDSRFLFHALTRPIVGHQLKKLTNTSAQAGVYLSKLKTLEIPLPPLSEQRRIAAILDRADAIRKKRREAIALADQFLRSAFLEMFGDPVTNPKGWEVKKLGEVTNRITDGTHQPPKWSSDGIPFIFVSNINNGVISLDTKKFISESTWKELTARCPIEQNDILYTTVGSYGNAALVRTKEKFAFQRHVAHIKPDSSKILPEFLSGMMNTSAIKRQADRKVKGIAQKTLNLSELKEFEVIVPSFDVQSSFIKIIQKKDHLVEQASKYLEESDHLFNSLTQRAFRGEL